MTAGMQGAATLASFVEGPSNRLAVAAVRTLAAGGDPGAIPVVIVAGRGLGKTHLLEALAAEAGGGEAPRHVERETVAGLAERAYGDRGGVLPLHECDLLLLDGVEAVSGRRDLLPLVLELLESRVPFGRQVVVATALPPARLGDAALARLLDQGLVVEISPPDPGTRLAILRRRAAELSPTLPDPVVSAVAALPFGSVRELLAALQRLVAFQAVSPAPLDPDQARILVGGVPPDPADAGAGVPAGRRQDDPPPALAVEDDEFGSFLSEVVAGVGHQVDRWRTQVGETVLSYGGEGYRTERLEALLEEVPPGGPAEALARYEADVNALKALEAEAVALAPDLAGAPAFRDPDRLADAEALLVQARRRRDPLPGPSAALRLERFAEGPDNRHAVQAAREAGQAPGVRHNPLVIVGPSGTGKTHLLHAIGNVLVDAGVEGVACLGAHALVAEAEGADRPGGARARYRFAGALLVDDLPTLGGHDAAQAVLLELLIESLDAGRQVVVTSSRPLATLAGITPHILTRLEAGLVVALGRPDREVRRSVIRQLVAGTAAEGDAALADWLAERPADSVRAVQGMLRRVLSAAESQGVLPSPALAREVLEHRAVAPPEGRRSGSHRAPGGVGPGMPQARSPEKMVTAWPRLADRLFEEFS